VDRLQWRWSYSESRIARRCIVDPFVRITIQNEMDRRLARDDGLYYCSKLFTKLLEADRSLSPVDEFNTAELIRGASVEPDSVEASKNR